MITRVQDSALYGTDQFANKLQHCLPVVGKSEIQKDNGAYWKCCYLLMITENICYQSTEGWNRHNILKIKSNRTHHFRTSNQVKMLLKVCTGTSWAMIPRHWNGCSKHTPWIQLGFTNKKWSIGAVWYCFFAPF